MSWSYIAKDIHQGLGMQGFRHDCADTKLSRTFIIKIIARPKQQILSDPADEDCHRLPTRHKMNSAYIVRWVLLSVVLEYL